jgi:hypothetical protein
MHAAGYSTPNGTPAPFLRNLRRMLDAESASVLSWTPNGGAIEIHDVVYLAKHVLPKYFKHANYSSFQRQLNYFRFRKWTRLQTDGCTFSNPYFVRDAPELACYIVRKRSMPFKLPTRAADTNSTTDVESAQPYGSMDDLIDTAAAFLERTLVPWAFSPSYPCGAMMGTALPPASTTARSTAIDGFQRSFQWLDDLYPSLEAVAQLDQS